MSLKDAVAKVSNDRTGTTPTNARSQPEPSPASSGDRSWDERMKRHTFHISVDQLAEMRTVAKTTNSSLTQILHDALEAHFAEHR